jgi:hypothetical protein
LWLVIFFCSIFEAREAYQKQKLPATISEIVSAILFTLAGIEKGFYFSKYLFTNTIKFYYFLKSHFYQKAKMNDVTPVSNGVQNEDDGNSGSNGTDNGNIGQVLSGNNSSTSSLTHRNLRRQ